MKKPAMELFNNDHFLVNNTNNLGYITNQKPINLDKDFFKLPIQVNNRRNNVSNFDSE